jgi:hypothetical protein
MIFDNGKTNNTGKKQYLGYMRNKDLIICTQKALAQYIYNRYHCWSAPSPWHVTWPLYGLAARIQYNLCATPPSIIYKNRRGPISRKIRLRILLNYYVRVIIFARY